MTSQNEPSAVLPMGKEDFKDWLKYHLLTSSLLDDVADQLYEHMAFKAKQNAVKEKKHEAAAVTPAAPEVEPGHVTVLNNPPVLDANARMPGEAPPGQAERMPISSMQGSLEPKRQGGMVGESSLASEKQLLFVKNIRDTLEMEKPTDEMLECFTKDDASYFIDMNLPAFRNKTNNKRPVQPEAKKEFSVHA